MAITRTVTDVEIAERFEADAKIFIDGLIKTVADLKSLVANWAKEKCPFCDSTVPHYHYHTHDGYVPAEPHPEKTGMTGNTKCNHVRFDRVHASYCPDCGMHRTSIEGGG